VTNYTVQSGGQLRLSSAGNPRNYLFKGPLSLAGNGRSGVAEDENLGVLGALRLETGTTGTVAVLTNNVHLTDSADIHVPATNAIRLDGPLTSATNTNVLTKSGGGTLTLSAGAATFTGGLAVNRGTLLLNNAQLTNTTRNLVLTNETTLAGTGRWGGALQSSAGATLSFSLGASPGGTAVLRVGSAALTGSNNVVLEAVAEAAPGSYPLLAVDGSFTGTNNLRLTQAPSNYPTASLSISNGTLFAVLPAGPAATALTVEVATEGGSGLTLPGITVRAVNPDNFVDTSFTGTVTLTITGADAYAQTFHVSATAGAAVFTGITVPAAGVYAISAASGALSTTGATSFQAVLPRVDLHAWRFDVQSTYLTPDAAVVAGGAITPEGTLSTEFFWNAADLGDGLPTGHFRVNNPLSGGKSVTFSLPTTGYENIRVNYDTRRSNQGAGTQVVSIRTQAGGAFAFFANITVAPAPPQPIALDFTETPGVADNPHFAVRITFERGAGGTGGNNRFDNFAASGTAQPMTPIDNRETWLAQYGLPTDGSGIGADTADPDGDGIGNIFERAMFLDPTSADSGLPATLGGFGANGINFIYRLAKGHDDLTVEVVASSSLVSEAPWLPLTPFLQDDTHPDFSIYRVELPTSGNAGFLRLRITR
jgi:autotransporter-associated beta strand protein